MNNHNFNTARELVCAMAQSHIEDIETGIQDGLYDAADNLNLDEKKLALAQVQDSGEESAGTPDPEPVTKVTIRHERSGAREYDAIRVVIADLHLMCDINSDRDIRLAHRLAEASGCALDVAPEMRERVAAALAGGGG